LDVLICLYAQREGLAGASLVLSQNGCFEVRIVFSESYKADTLSIQTYEYIQQQNLNTFRC
ncbi:MAG: hypothetical protein AAFO94_19765, partial [Bacteroidota bacterium]